MLLQNVFCTRLMPVDRPLKAAFAIFPTQGSRHHKYDTNVCKKGYDEAHYQESQIDLMMFLVIFH